MDMKALLRGIGVGLIAAAAVTSVSGVITRQQGADTLFSRPSEVPGMTETAAPQSDEDPKASDTPKVSEMPQTSETPAASEAPEAGAAPKTSEAPEAGAAPKASEAPEINEKPEASAVPKNSEPPKQSGSSGTGGVQADQTQADQEVYTLQITRGMESYHVAKALAKEGIVPDIQSFNKYLAAQPISENMQVGSYDIPYTATYEQIVEILEGKTTAQALLHGGTK